MAASEDEELNNLRQLIEAAESGDHETLGKAQAEYLRAFSNIGSEDGVSKSKKPHSQHKSRVNDKSSRYSAKNSKYERGWNQSVAKLLKQKRHKKPVVISPSISVFDLACILCRERRNAALVKDDISSKIVGIITDADICKRVVGKKLKPREVTVGAVMTANPISVGPETDILEIFDLMCKNRFRHLPILDDTKETVYGLVDIAQCLYDAIQRIEKAQKKEIDFMHTVQRAHLRWNSDTDQAGVTAVLAQEIINDMMQRICPKVSIILEKESQDKENNRNVLLLTPDTSVQAAVIVMAKQRKTAVLGVPANKSVNEVFGIFTTKDLLSKVVAKEIDPEKTSLAEVMTKNPDTVEADSSLLEALHTMHDGRFLHVPVVTTDADTEEENVVGILDVLDCAVHTLSRFTHSDKNHLISSESDEHDYIYNTKVDSEADKAMFTSLFLRDDVSEPSALERQNSGHRNGSAIHINDSISQAGAVRVKPPKQNEPTSTTLRLKIRDLTSGQLYRSQIQTEDLNFVKLKQKVSGLVRLSADHGLYYLDEDGDEIILSSDACLQAALEHISSENNKLTVVVRSIKKEGVLAKDLKGSAPVLIGVAVLCGLLLGLTLVSSRNNSGSHGYRRYN